MLVLVACVAVNFWLFRLGFLWGVVGLNVTKHVVIAQLCHAVGLEPPGRPIRRPIPTPSRLGSCRRNPPRIEEKNRIARR